MSDHFLVADRITKHFGGLKAVGGDDGLSFKVKRGEFVGLIGPNGAGKSTLFNVISGVLKPTSGRVTLDGIDLLSIRPSDIASHGLSRTFQTPRAFMSLSVFDNVLVGSSSPGEYLWSSLCGGWKTVEDDLKSNAERALERVGLKERIHDSVANLSGGELRMLEVARQLVRDPQILLLDEPTAGVDPSLQGKLGNILVNLHQDGRTLIVVEHNLNFLLKIAEKIIVLKSGQLLSEGSPDQIKSDPKVIAAYLGDDHAA